MTVTALLPAVGPGPVNQTRGVRTDVTLAGADATGPLT